MKQTHLALILLIFCLIGIATCGTAAANDTIIDMALYDDININVTDDDGKPIDEDGNLVSVSGKPQKVVKADTILLTWNATGASPTATSNQTVIITYNSEVGYKRITNMNQTNCVVTPVNLSPAYTSPVSYNPDDNHIIFTGTSDQIAIIIRGGPTAGISPPHMDLSQLTFVLENLTLTSDDRSPISVENRADITFELRGTSTLRGGTGTGKMAYLHYKGDPEYESPVYDRAGKAGLDVGADSSITIKSKTDEKGTLIAYGGDGLNGIEYNQQGKLNGAGGGGAGIGTMGAHYLQIGCITTEYKIPTSGNITIENSIIYAIGGDGGKGAWANMSGAPGAGIGGGGSAGSPGSLAAKAGNITIKDDNEIYATAGKFAHGENDGPAIGGGPQYRNYPSDNNIGEYGPGCSLRIEGENTSIITFSNGFGYLTDYYSSDIAKGIIFTAGNILQFDGGSQFAKSSAGALYEDSLSPITYIVTDLDGNAIPGVKITSPGNDNFTTTYTRSALTAEKIEEIKQIMGLTGTRNLDPEKTYLFDAGSATVWGKQYTTGITFTAPGYVEYVDNVNEIKWDDYNEYNYPYRKVSYGKVVEIKMTPLMVQYESATGLNDGNSYQEGSHIVWDIAGAGITAPPGKVFEKWLGSDDIEYMPGETIPLTGVLTLTAQWTTPAFNVQYESESGDTDGILDPAGLTYIVLNAVAADVTAPAGMVFDYWLDSDGITHYAPGQTIPMTTNLTLTAQWITPPYTVQYESNSGSADGILDPAGTAYVVLDIAASCISIPGGVAFDSWLGSDGVSYDSGDTITMTTSLTLTAQWVTASYTVQYESDAGEMDGRSYPAGATHTARGASEADVMGPSGKVFDKWLGSDGNTYVSGSKITVTSDLVLTAQWKTLGTGSSGSGGSGGGTGTAKLVGGTAAPVTPTQPDQPQSGSQNNNQNNNQNNAPQTIIQQMDFDESKLIRTIAIVGLISGLVGSVIGGALISVVGRKK